MTVSTILTNKLSNKFTPTEIADGITESLTLLKPLAGEAVTADAEEEWDTAIILLVPRLLRQKRMIEDEEDWSNYVLITDQIREIMEGSADPDDGEMIFDNSRSTETWEDGVEW